jgi:hypothetical protein
MSKQIQIADELADFLDKIRGKQKDSYSTAIKSLIRPKRKKNVIFDEIIPCVEDDDGNLIPVDDLEDEDDYDYYGGD